MSEDTVARDEGRYSMSKTGPHNRLVTWALLCLLSSLVCCGGEPAGPPAAPSVEVAPPGPWLSESGGRRDWGHDGQPFESTHFVVYSDGSSLDAKRQLAALAEAVLQELIETFGLAGPFELGLGADQKYWIYANMRHQGVRGEGYRHGLIIPALDSSLDPYNQTDPEGYRAELKHEVVHTIQFTLTDCSNLSRCPEWLEVWFSEGLAVYLAGEAHWLSPITTPEQYERWRAQSDHVNPISIRLFENYPPGHHFTDYYPMFGLALAYLLDTEAGHGSTITDIRVLFDLMSANAGFRAAFEQALGLAVEEFEAGFFELMEAYLRQGVSATGAGGASPWAASGQGGRRGAPGARAFALGSARGCLPPRLLPSLLAQP